MTTIKTFDLNLFIVKDFNEKLLHTQNYYAYAATRVKYFYKSHANKIKIKFRSSVNYF